MEQINKGMKATVTVCSSTLVCTYCLCMKIITKATTQLCLTITESKANELNNLGLNPEVKGTRDSEKAVHISCVL